MDYQVRLSRSAQLDLQDIVRYISIDDPNRALVFGSFLIKHTERLGQFPEMDALCRNSPTNQSARSS